MRASDLFNFTPHAIRIYTAPDQFIEIPPQPNATRLDVSNFGSVHDSLYIDNVKVPVIPPPRYVDVINLPNRNEHKHIVVSQLVAEYMSTHGYKEVFVIYSPDTGPEAVVRGDRGEILGTRRLIKW
jgi:hypothetical protein